MPDNIVSHDTYIKVKNQIKVYVDRIISDYITKHLRYPQFKTVLDYIQLKLCFSYFAINDLDEDRKVQFMNTVYGWYTLNKYQVMFLDNTRGSFKGEDGLSTNLSDYKTLRNTELEGFCAVLPEIVENIFDKLTVNNNKIPTEGEIFDNLYLYLKIHGLFYMNFKFKHKVEIEKIMRKEYNRIKGFYEEYSAGK